MLATCLTVEPGAMKTASLAVLAALVLAVGGAVHWARQSPAAAATHERAVRLFNAMETYPGSTAVDQAREAKRYGDVRILVARGDGDDRVIVLAVTATSSRASNADVSFLPDSRVYRATRCYRWTPDRAWDTADRVDCPEHRDVDPTTGPRSTPVTARTEHEVQAALEAGADAQAVRARVPGADVRAAGDVLAVAVPGVRGYDSGHRVNDCLLARRDAHGVQVWSLGPTQVAPGELSCTADLALHPPAPPH
jgi:hypothetical protein